MSNSTLFESDAAKYFPKPTKEDVALFDSLPERFCLDVPYVEQDSIQGSGTACLKMLAEFQGLDPSPGLTMIKETEADWKSFNHETLAEDFARAMIKVGLLPYEYYPGRFVLPAFEEGYLGADFIAKNFGEISKIDQLLMKSAIFGSKTPIFARVHFDTDEYAMSDEMASVLDTSGHGVVLCGWDEEGFIVHDPWPRDRFGGYGGGRLRVLSFKRLSEINPFVNCCADGSHGGIGIKGFIRVRDRAVHEGRDIVIEFELENSGLPSFYRDYIRWDYEMALEVPHSFTLKSQKEHAVTYAHAMGTPNARVQWDVHTGNVHGSHGIEVHVLARGTYPVFPWETAKRAPQPIEVRRTFKTRIDVKRLEWLNKYARV